MKTTRKRLMLLWLLVTWMLLAPLLTSCAPRVAVIPSERLIKSLPSGNYEVTPAWLQERYRYERWAADELEKCKAKK